MAEQTEEDAPTDALWSRLRLIEGQPLADRAEAYGALHEELSKRLGAATKADGQHPAGAR